MKIVVAKRAGFCFGVKRAIDTAFELVEKGEKGIYSLGPLIHNPQVVEELKGKGVTPTENIHSGKIKTLIIRTHGVSPDIFKEISTKGYTIVDTTCPFVKKAQKHVRTLKEEGYQVVILGDRNHPEVQALLGFAGADAVVVNYNDSIPSLKGRVGLIVQTTQPLDILRKVACQIIGLVRELKIYNTICDSTTLRLEETKRLAKGVDIFIVVGGKNSANTTQLAVLSKSICAKVYHIEGSHELKKGWFRGVDKVGITGGASTPQWIIDDVVEKIEKISCGR